MLTSTVIISADRSVVGLRVANEGPGVTIDQSQFPNVPRFQSASTRLPTGLSYALESG